MHVDSAAGSGHHQAAAAAHDVGVYLGSRGAFILGGRDLWMIVLACLGDVTGLNRTQHPSLAAATDRLDAAVGVAIEEVLQGKPVSSPLFATETYAPQPLSRGAQPRWVPPPWLYYARIGFEPGGCWLDHCEFALNHPEHKGCRG